MRMILTAFLLMGVVGGFGSALRHHHHHHRCHGTVSDHASAHSAH